MSERSSHIVLPASFDDLNRLLEERRSSTQDFSSFELLSPYSVWFTDGHSAAFFSGDRVTHYSKAAFVLATLNSDTLSLKVTQDGHAELAHHDLTEVSRFNTWMNRQWKGDRAPEFPL